MPVPVDPATAPVDAPDPDDDHYCPVKATMELLGRKWTLQIITELISGKRRFNELSQALGGVNSRTLRERLKDLEAEGIVRRTVVSYMPPWVEYELTEKGQMLNTLVDTIAAWGIRWMSRPEAPADGVAGDHPAPSPSAAATPVVEAAS